MIMKLTELLKNIEVLSQIGLDCEINEICTDTRKATRGSCFVCIKGFVTDGHIYAPQAIEAGSSAVVLMDEEYQRDLAYKYRDLIKDGHLTLIQVANTRHAMAMLSDAISGHPSGKLDLIGITGTKGKTTTSLMIKNVFDKKNVKTGLVGTMYNMIGERIIETERTTPEANVLQPLLAEMVGEGVKTCIMECSSQGLKLERTGGCEYKIGVFTNLSPDHIGANEHPDMDDYARSKGLLFRHCKVGVVNADSSWLPKVIDGATCEIVTYGIDNKADFMAENIVYHSDSVEYDVIGKCEKTHVTVKIPGKFTVYNSLAAFATCFISGCEISDILNGISSIVVKGKAEIVPTGRDFTVMIDYAHNPDSFINIITTAKQFAKRVVFLFGAGGDRNRPRALMGETAATHADFTIITSDNPRSEDPAKIVADIAVGAEKTGKPYVCIVDRREAICYAIDNARPGDVIILAGKGHETYQIFKDKTVEFDERVVVKEALEKGGV